MYKLSVGNIRQHVFIICRFNYTRVVYSTGLPFEKVYWRNNVLSKNHPEYDRYMEIIGEGIQLMTNAVMEASKLGPLTAENVRLKIQEIKQSDIIKAGRAASVHLQFQLVSDFIRYIETKKAFLTHNTIRNYNYTRAILEEFEEYMDTKLDIQTFDYKQLEQFVAFLILKKDLLNNTVAKHISVLKVFIRYTYPGVDTKFLKYKAYMPEVIALTEDELTIVKYTPMNGYKAKTKDLFLFLASTGMRYSDSQRFNFSWVDDDVIEYSAQKTKSRAFVPMFSQAKEIVERYGGRPPKISSQRFNDYLKLVLKDCGLNRPVVLRDRQGNKEIETIYPIWEVASSHLGRKTFISIMLEKGVPIQDVMNMSGHQDYRSMKPYIFVNRKRLRDFSKRIDI